ncbi:MAG: hypothetical protein EU529_04460 [Promethearchaeota archaeon]|nr:MAG: hypothetical protein EU529_04460 [Candidatus Lokiarchaeota archaeon]
MSKKLSSKLDLISKFLNPKTVKLDKLKDIESVFKLPLSAYKFLEERDVENIQKIFRISKIKDFTKLNQEDPFKELFKSDETKSLVKNILKAKPELEEKIKKAITITILIELIKQKSFPIEKEKQKVVVLGLDNAGKTAIISKIGGRLGIENIAELEPTKGIDFQTIKTHDMELAIWDFGGQQEYRKSHLSKEQNFLNTHLLVYVIDVQDPEKFDDNFQYFNEILQILDRIEIYPQIIVLIHKYDPEIRDDPDISLQVEVVKDIVSVLLKEKKFDYEVYLSSIYSLISKKPKFSLSLKEILRDKDSFLYDTEATTEKISSLGETIKKTLNAVITLSEFCNELERRIVAIESVTVPKELSQQIFAGPIEASPPSHPSTESTLRLQGPNVRQSLMTELKDLFAKKRKLDRS